MIALGIMISLNIWVCLCSEMFACTHAYKRTRIFMCMYICLFIFMCVYVYKYIIMYVCMYIGL